MAYKFTVTIDYPQSSPSPEQYRLWVQETLGSTLFNNLESRLVDEYDINGGDDRKTIRVDNGSNITQTNYYLNEDQASDMHLDMSTLLESLGGLALVSDMETITVEEYNAAISTR